MVATRSQNAASANTTVSEKTGFRGVRFDKSCPFRPFLVRIKVDAKDIYIGHYSTAREGAFAYNEQALRFFGEFARFNVL